MNDEIHIRVSQQIPLETRNDTGSLKTVLVIDSMREVLDSAEKLSENTTCEGFETDLRMVINSVVTNFPWVISHGYVSVWEFDPIYNLMKWIYARFSEDARRGRCKDFDRMISCSGQAISILRNCDVEKERLLQLRPKPCLV